MHCRGATRTGVGDLGVLGMHVAGRIADQVGPIVFRSIGLSVESERVRKRSLTQKRLCGNRGRSGVVNTAPDLTTMLQMRVHRLLDGFNPRRDGHRNRQEDMVGRLRHHKMASDSTLKTIMRLQQ